MPVTRILLAEDNPADVYLIREALSLETQSVELVVVQDGEQALTYVSRADAAVPELVVLDLNLPKSDGGDVLRGIRRNEKYQEVPVVILTSSDSPRDREAIEALGASGFLTKPSDLDAFLSLGPILLGFIGQKEVDESAEPASSAHAI